MVMASGLPATILSIVDWMLCSPVMGAMPREMA